MVDINMVLGLSYPDYRKALSKAKLAASKTTQEAKEKATHVHIPAEIKLGRICYKDDFLPEEFWVDVVGGFDAVVERVVIVPEKDAFLRKKQKEKGSDLDPNIEVTVSFRTKNGRVHAKVPRNSTIEDNVAFLASRCGLHICPDKIEIPSNVDEKLCKCSYKKAFDVTIVATLENTNKGRIRKIVRRS